MKEAVGEQALPDERSARRREFERGWSFVAMEAHRNAVDKGFDPINRNDGESIALMHSELSEALEAIREGNPPSKKAPGYSALEEEIADLVIRAMDYSMARGLNVPGAVSAKMRYNSGRPHMHGKKF